MSVDDLVQSMGICDIGKIEVPHRRRGVDERASAILAPRINGAGPLYGSTPPT